MKEGDVVAGICKHFVERGADEFAATNEGDLGIVELNIVAGEEPIDGGGGGGVEFGVFSETVDVFFGCDKIAKFIGFSFIF